MRLWTLHPKYLDAKGLVALWREALLAQAVLAGATEGYRSHPQLIRFRENPDPGGSIGEYLVEVLAEAARRRYSFDGSKILRKPRAGKLEETSGQLAFERDHLLRKLEVRDPARREILGSVLAPDAHPLFRIVEGPVRDWERGAEGG